MSPQGISIVKCSVGWSDVQHVLVKHGPWFVEKYGSLSVWSCQGMEKSHHAAKASTQYHSQHGGTTKRVSIVVQQYQFWYRNIQHRYEAKLELKRQQALRSVPNMVATTAASKRRKAWWASDAPTACAAWREGRNRVSSRYVSQLMEAKGTESSRCNEGVPCVDGQQYGLFREESSYRFQ